MKKKRFSEQQILEFLKEAEAGISVKELCRKHGFSDAATGVGGRERQAEEAAGRGAPER